MTPQQLATLKASILADPALSAQPMNSDGAFAIAAALNLTASPAFFIWRNKGEVTLGEIMGNGFDYTRIDNLTVGRARIWDDIKIALQLGEFSGAAANHRAGVAAAFNQAADSGMRLALFTHLSRAATRAEKIFATGAGTAATEAGTGPATTEIYGMLSLDDIQQARSL